nr:hypothetical protein CFP56_22513 [Quercus suber]
MVQDKQSSIHDPGQVRISNWSRAASSMKPIFTTELDRYESAAVDVREVLRDHCIQHAVATCAWRASLSRQYRHGSAIATLGLL